MSELERMNLSAAIYLYEQSEKELEFHQSEIKAADLSLAAAEEGLAYAIEAYEPDEPDRFLAEAEPWVPRIRQAAQRLALAAECGQIAAEALAQAAAILEAQMPKRRPETDEDVH
jgi:hypothetical protein